MLGSWEIAYIDSTHRKLSKTGLRCSGTILEGGVLFIECKSAHWALFHYQGFNPHRPTRTQKLGILRVTRPIQAGHIRWCMWVLCDGIDLNFFFWYFKFQKYRYFNLFLKAQWVQFCDIEIWCFFCDWRWVLHKWVPPRFWGEYAPRVS